MEINKIYCVDCLELLKQIDDNSIDLILTDTPFNVANKNIITRKNTKNISADYEWDYMSEDEYIDFLTNLFLLLHKKLKRHGSLIFFYQKVTAIGVVLRYIKDYFYLKSEKIAWHKNNPAPQFRKMNYLSSIELLCWLVKDKSNFTFNFLYQKEMHNFIEMPICAGHERTSHPNQKPIKLLNHFIRIHSNPGNLIFDPFLGSGTTAISCIRSNRNYIGCEIDKGYFDIAEKRIANELALKEMELFNGNK